MAVIIPEIQGLTPNQVRTLGNCKGYAQYCEMVTAYIEKRCMFCSPLGPLNKVIHENDCWRMWPNPFAQKKTQTHLVLAPIRHVISVEDITRKDMIDMGDLFLWACREFRLPGGGFVQRFGSAEYNAGTVEHIHANIMVPDLTGEVRFPLAKEDGEFQEGIDRIPIFERLRCGVSATDLSFDEMKLIEGRI